jgi:hypothetical protein
MGPDERSFRTHIDAGPFQAGVQRGDWNCGSIEWPHAIITVRAAARPSGPEAFALQFELDQYPQQLPTARPWDPTTNQPLAQELWPIGEQASGVFNPNWNQGALYIPCDRVAIHEHPGWNNDYPSYRWDPARDITQYLRVVRDVLNGPGYAGVRPQAA